MESTGEEVTPVERTVGEGIEREMLPVVTLTAAEDSLFLYVPEQFQDTVQVEEEYYHQIGQGQLEILREMRQLLPLADGGWKLPLQRRGEAAEKAYYTIMYGNTQYFDLRVDYPAP